jgi:hypothetical protein
MPLHFSHSSRLSIFRASRWGASVLPSSSCCWRSTIPWGLALFSHRSASRIFIMEPGCSSPSVVTQNDGHQPCGGEERAGLWPPPALNFKDVHHPCWGRWQAELGSCLPHGLATRFFLQHSGEKAFASLVEEANCHLLPGLGVAVRPPHGRRPRRARVSHVHGPSRVAGHTGGRTGRRTPQGRCPRSWMVLFLLP